MIAVRDGDKIYSTGKISLNSMEGLGYSREHAQQYFDTVQSIKHSDVQEGIGELFQTGLNGRERKE